MHRFVAILLLAATPACAGTLYDYEIAHTGSKDWLIKAAVEIDGADQRVNLHDVTGYMATTAQSEYRTDAFAISTDDGGSATFFYPQQRQSLHKVFTETPATNGFSTGIENPKVTVRDLGDGGVIDGMPTRKIEIELSFVRVIDVGGNRTSSGKTEYVSDVWTTDRIAASDTSFIMNRFFQDQMPAEINRLIDAKADFGQRFAVRRVTTVRVRIKDEIVTSITTESLTNHRNAVIPAAEFTLPAGYDEVAHAPVPQK